MRNKLYHMPESLRERLTKIFPTLYRERMWSKGEIRFFIEYASDMTYEKLCRLSELLDTTNINFESKNSYGYYEDVTTHVMITASEVNFEKLGITPGEL